MNFLIIGSGFGIYGYLPAVYKFTKKIYLNIKYKKKFINRLELKKFSDKIVWYNNIRIIIDDIDHVVIAKQPKDQFKIVKEIYLKKKIKHFFLEKPLDINPKKSNNFLKFLKKNKLNYSLGLLFRYLRWYNYIKLNRRSTNFTINWDIKKRKKNNKWKYNSKQGGGLLKFYGIHFLYLLIDLKYIKIKKYFFKKNSLKLSFLNTSKFNIDINIKFAKNDNFEIKTENKTFFKSVNPFSKKILRNKIDPRVSVLQKYLKQNLNNYKNYYKDDIKLIRLWSKLENE